MAHPDDYSQVVHLLLTYLTADTWDDRKHIVEENQDVLLSDEVDAIFADLEMHREFLQRCRDVGVEAAHEELRQKKIAKLRNWLYGG